MARSRETKIELTAYDDLFQTDESREEAKLSKIRDIPISEIDEFPDHPFKVLMDEDMEQLVESIKRNGVMTPATVRLKEDGRYELISGHRRKKACELAGLETLKCEVKELTRDEAIIVALITLFNIINSIAMSVVAKMKQYGVFRAIGLSNRQLAKMIIAEASTYAITGTICGSVLGIVCNKILFSKLITYKWGDAWSVPLVQLGIIIVVVAIAVILAVRNPIKKLEKTSIVDIISVQ